MQRSALAFRSWWWLFLVALAGCADQTPPAASPPDLSPSLVSYATDFHAATTGTLCGRVVWEGTAPLVPRICVPSSPAFYPPWPKAEMTRSFPNPNAPHIDPRNCGVGQVVVYLKRVDPQRCRPWNHGPVTAVLRDDQLLLVQGSQSSATAFVRRGARVEMVSREERYHMMRAAQLVPAGQGAFFTLTLPAPEQPRYRTLAQTGVVEFSEAAGYYWLRSYAFVDDHPYYTHTDAAGHFNLRQVPPGKYELAAWMPNWHITRQEYDPESRSAVRLFYGAPVEQRQSMRVRTAAETTVHFTFRADQFDRSASAP